MPEPTASLPTAPERVRLPEEDAQLVLLTRAFEEADSQATLLVRGERQRASKLARDASFERFLVGRGRELVEILEREMAMLPRLRRAVRLKVALTWVVVPALLFGLLSNLLGPDKRINVVANPLAGLILWNLAIYVLIAVGFVWSKLRTSSGTESVQPSLSLATRLATWPARAAGREMSQGKPGRSATLASGVGRFLEFWNQTARPLLSARVKLALHCGAAVAVLGAIGGMYVRGLVLEYQASWESTFLGADQVQTLLGWMLGPASAVSGIELPDVATIQGSQAGNAGRWIHLYAVTTVLYVLVPRFLLAWWASLRARRSAAGLEIRTDGSYYRRLLASEGGGEVVAQVLPYSYTLSATRADRLKSVLHDVLGARARITIEGSIGYGELPDELEDPDAGPAPTDGRVLLFNLSQTPESEVHGELVEKLKQRTQRGGFCLVVADGSAWRERAGQAPAFEQRLAEHRRTWDRVVRDAGLRAVHLELDQPPSDDLVSILEAAIHPPRLVKAESAS